MSDTVQKDYNEIRASKSMADQGNLAFIPEYYHFEEPAPMLAYIEQNPMCQLTSYYQDELLSTALPLIPCPREPGHYIAHMARRNKHSHAVEAG
jgi:predicted FMN-binding regulatory protein PaiB